MHVEFVVQRHFEGTWIDEHLIPDGFEYSEKRTPEQYARHNLLLYRTILFPGIMFRLVKRFNATALDIVLEE